VPKVGKRHQGYGERRRIANVIGSSGSGSSRGLGGSRHTIDAASKARNCFDSGSVGPTIVLESCRCGSFANQTNNARSAEQSSKSHKSENSVNMGADQCCNSARRQRMV
jgi:hypothetical protein